MLLCFLSSGLVIDESQIYIAGSNQVGTLFAGTPDTYFKAFQSKRGEWPNSLYSLRQVTEVKLVE